MQPVEFEIEELFHENILSVVEREKTTFDRLLSPFEKSLVLVGAGSLGKQVLSCLRKDGIEPVAFADNSLSLQGKYVDGVQVLSRKQAAEKYGSSAAFVVTIWNTDHSFIKTRKELTEINCKKVVSAIPLRWKYSKSLLPFFWLDVPSKTCENASLIKSAFSLWADEFSRKEYIAQLKFRIHGEFDSLSEPVPQESYFPDDLFDLLPDEKFVDCGAYDGVTIKHFLKRQKGFTGKVVAYEPDPKNYSLLKQYVANLDESIRNNVISLPYAVGARREKVCFNATGTMGSTINNEGETEVTCVTLDENLGEIHAMPTYIKMDIEGSELDALAGARNIIRKGMPILTICLYHRYDDLWRIPLFINSLAGEYRLFLRPHEIEGWQLVCYAIPSHRLKI